jgi:hypothetical protein
LTLSILRPASLEVFASVTDDHQNLFDTWMLEFYVLQIILNQSVRLCVQAPFDHKEKKQQRSNNRTQQQQQRILQH